VSGLRLSIRQVYYTNKAFWRNPAAAFFTFAFPLMFLIIFTTLLGNNEVPVGGREVSVATYYVAAMATFSIISACFMVLVGLSMPVIPRAGINWGVYW